MSSHRAPFFSPRHATPGPAGPRRSVSVDAPARRCDGAHSAAPQSAAQRRRRALLRPRVLGVLLAALLYWAALAWMTFGPRPAHAHRVSTPAALATARAGCFGPGAGPAPGVDTGVGGSLLLPSNRAAAAARFFY